MVYVLVLILMLAAFAAVGWPLLSSAKRNLSPRSETSLEWEKLVDERDAAYKAIKDLQFEHDLGNLSTQDYQSLHQRYRIDAAAALQKLDELRRSGKAEATADAAPKTAPPGPTRAASRSAQAKSTGAPAAAAHAYPCPSCGKSVPADDRFCANCGTAVQRVCPSCGVARPGNDLFCSHCGTRMETEA